MNDPTSGAEMARYRAELLALHQQVARLTADLERRDADRAASTSHRIQESQLQRSMLASLQSERASLLEEIERLRRELEALGADSARIAIRRAFRMLLRAVQRRLRRD